MEEIIDPVDFIKIKTVLLYNRQCQKMRRQATDKENI
jgi:hypothetical protein